MRPMRGFNRGGGGGFGGGFVGLESMAAKLAVALVAFSALFLATRGGQGVLLLLNPTDVLRGRVWELFTYAFIAPDPLGIIFGGIIIWSIGGFLESTWGSRRLLMASVGITVFAGLLTVLLALVMPMASAYAGGSVMTTVLWVAYGLVIGRGQANFWGIPLTGNWFAAIGAGFTVLRLLTAPSWQFLAPELFSLVLVFAYVRGASPKRLMLHLQHWRLQRQLRDRSKHLRVVGKERPPDRDQFLN
ncbi:rhomboid family intramembrane serine protease [Corallococcus praedator]|uniref:Rhomboid family intramembrane serine protease n=1 Tax=Corallococcus praedator TaxID=2316724 RepID=A0ABX9QBC1_9BACT|nr:MULTISPECIES: rhomboid family intramembrane serine protease [Corallococcus]RKH12284.1 rhomboid family intramembrane serine protease [Corallococcus sp. CA047B]RKH22450.1 rhomboid family intramembrane serine protease [Corallococcus sp. CA031C]RKH95883.1 rhomboid family intramembrane serine protease [Corallococcus praedator]